MKQHKVYFLLSGICLLVLVVGLFSCGNSGGGAIKLQKVDTATVFAKYVTAPGDDVVVGEVVRYIYQDLKPDSSDLSKNKVVTDSAYAVPALTLIRDSVTNKFILDSAGNPIKTIRLWMVPKYQVFDTGVKADTAMHSKMLKLRRHERGRGDTLAVKQGQ